MCGKSEALEITSSFSAAEKNLNYNVYTMETLENNTNIWTGKGLPPRPWAKNRLLDSIERNWKHIYLYTVIELQPVPVSLARSK